MIQELKGNMWKYYHDGHWVCITTNATIKQNGEAVMGKGCARQAAHLHPDIPKALGFLLQTYQGLQANRHVHVFPGHRMFMFQVKYNWWEKADLQLIEESCKQLMEEINSETLKDIKKPVILPRPGCGNGGLSWENEVKPALDKHLDEQVAVISP